MSFGGHDQVVFDPDPDAYMILRDPGTLERAGEVQARLDGENHSRLQHSPITTNFVIANIVYIHTQPMTGTMHIIFSITFPFPERLQKLGNSLFAPIDEENAPRIVENVELVQGSVETSNVEVVTEMVRMIQAQRSYETTQRAIRTEDELNRQAITLAEV